MITKHKAGMGKRIAMLGILAGLGLIAFLLESLIPLPYLPGAKLGLANIFSMLALALYGLPDALVIVFARTFLGSLFAGNISMILYSMTAGVVPAGMVSTEANAPLMMMRGSHPTCRLSSIAPTSSPVMS